MDYSLTDYTRLSFSWEKPSESVARAAPSDHDTSRPNSFDSTCQKMVNGEKFILTYIANCFNKT